MVWASADNPAKLNAKAVERRRVYGIEVKINMLTPKNKSDIIQLSNKIQANSLIQTYDKKTSFVSDKNFNYLFYDCSF